jgi:lysophospholipase L1-like esterase
LGGQKVTGRRWGFRLAAVLIGLLLSLTAVEIYLRAFGTGGGFYEPDAVLGSRLMPNGTGHWRKACFNERIQINSQGLHDVEHSLEKPPGVQRIAILGDSIAEALQVPMEESFSRRLEAMLNAEGGRQKTEVINFGVSGYGTDQEYLTLKTRAVAYQPDVVVLEFTIGNDVRNNFPPLERQQSSYPKPFFHLDPNGRLVPLSFTVVQAQGSGVVGRVKVVLRHFRLYDFLVSWVRARAWVRSVLGNVGLLQNADVFPPTTAGGTTPGGRTDPAHLDYEVYRRAPDPAWAEAWRVTEALIRAVRDDAQRIGARFLLLPVPGAVELATPGAIQKEFSDYRPELYDLAGPRTRLQRLAEAERTEYVSVFDAFAGDLKARGGALTDLFFWCDGHLTPRGHELVAQAIADHLRHPPGRPRPPARRVEGLSPPGRLEEG